MALVNAAIRHTKATDGASIAFWTMGSGPPLVMVEIPCFSHVELELRIPDYEAWYGRLAESLRIVRLDLRGGGLSQRDIPVATIEDFADDVESVMKAAGLERAALFAHDGAAPIAIHLAANRPDLVSHLFLYDAWANGAELPIHARFREFDHLIDVDWPLYTEMVAKVMMEREGAQARAVASYLRRCSLPGDWKRVAAATRDFNVTGLLPSVACPTTIIHSGRNRLSPLECSHDLAAAITAAELHVLNHLQLPAGGVEDVAGLIEDALGVVRTTKPAVATAHGLRTILFTDIAGHSGMMARLGDAATRIILREHERLTREALHSHGGSEVKSLGDGFMATFTSAHQALECAVELQQAVATSPVLSRVDESGLRIKVGMNAGEPIAEDGDYFGQSVIVASRLAGIAAGGEILVTNVVRELAIGRGFAFVDRGERVPRGLQDPVRVWQLDWAAAGLTEGG